jgi:hypothetical protein
VDGKRRSRQDFVCVAFLVLLTALATWQRGYYDSWVSGHDIFSFHLPWFSLVGQRLRAFQIPAWNPYVNSGSPLAGDPQSGWMLIQSMLAFTVFPNPVTALKMMVGLELLIGGLATYALARALKLTPPAACLAAIVFEFGPLFYHTTAANCCAVRGFMAPWIPVALLGVELALAPKPWRRRLAPICLAGLGMSQFYASFLGQGALDAMLLIGGYVVYRAWINPPERTSPFRDRLGIGLGVGLGALLFSGMISAAGLLPRLSFISKTELNQGYAGITDIERGNIPSVPVLLYTLISDRPWERFLSVGGVAVVFFIFGVALSWKRHCVPFFAIFTVVCLVLAMPDTPLHALFYLIPRFKDLHKHYAEQETTILMIGPAIVAGAGFDALLILRRRKYWLAYALGPFVALAGVFVYLEYGDYSTVGVTSIIAGGLATVVIVAMTAWSGSSRAPLAGLSRLGPALLLAIAFVLPTGVQLLIPMTNLSPGSLWETVINVNPQGSAALAIGTAPTAPGQAGEFLQQQLAVSGPFRYVGYAGFRYGAPHFKWDYDYPIFRLQPNVLGILTNGRSMFLHIYDTQVYNPSQYNRYSLFIQAMNKINEDYHFSDLNETGIDSPWFPLLNARYVLLDKSIPMNRSDAVAIMQGRRVVFEDSHVRVLESAGAQPAPAWIVHQLDPQPFDNVLSSMQTPEFDPRTMAITEQQNPWVEPLAPDANESAAVTAYAPESMTIKATAASKGMLVVSEVYDPDWHAYVDGKRIAIQPVDMAFRGIPLDVGEHTVVLRYEPDTLRYGLWLTGIALAFWLALGCWRAYDMWRPRPAPNRLD